MTKTNNSRFRFRAWNKWEETMYLSPPELEHIGRWLDTHLPGATAYKDNIEIMQWTGLTDKNGKQIFEGDVVRRFLNGNIINEQIVYKQNEAKFCTLTEYEEGDIFTTMWSGTSRKNLEVIGDIYRNPELLEEK